MNGDNTSNAFAYAYYERKIFKDLMEISFNYQLSSYNSNSIINDIKNYSSNLNNRIGWGMDYDIEKVFKLGFNYAYSYATNTNKGTTTTETIIVGHDLDIETGLDFLKHYYIRADYNLNKNKGNTPSAKPFQIQMLNASAGYKFLKNKAELGMIAHNILNQNNGYSLYQSATSVIRSQNNILGRYFMLSFTYNFSNKGGIQKEDDDD